VGRTELFIKEERMSGKKKSANGLQEKISEKKSIVGLKKDMELELTIEDMG